MQTWDNICDMETITRTTNGTRMRKPLDTMGSRLKWLRDISGLRQEDARELAQNRSGVTFGQSYLSELENDKKTPGGDVVMALAMTYGTSMDFIYGLTEDPRSYDEIIKGAQNVGGDDGGDELLDAYSQLNEKRRQELLSLAALLLESQVEATKDPDIVQRLALISTIGGDELRRWAEGLL